MGNPFDELRAFLSVDPAWRKAIVEHGGENGRWLVMLTDDDVGKTWNGAGDTIEAAVADALREAGEEGQ